MFPHASIRSYELHALAYKDPDLKVLFDDVLGSHWPPKISKKKSSESCTSSAPDKSEQLAQDSPQDSQVEDDGSNEALVEADGYSSGETTPPPSHAGEERELLAWTLGGDFKSASSPLAKCLSPGFGGKRLADAPPPDSDEWIAMRLAELELPGRIHSL